jgi:hypothetical protein
MLKSNSLMYSPFGQPKTGLKNLLKINSSTYWFFSSHMYLYIIYLLRQIISEFWHYFPKSCPLGLYVKYCTKCGYVQRELVCLLLPTSIVNNNNNTCGFINISLSCDYLIWICHQNPSMHEMFISLSSDNRLFHKQTQRFSPKV